MCSPKRILFWFALSIICLILESVATVDEFFQRPFFINNQWIISEEFHAKYKWLLYTGIKVCIIIFAIGLFLYALSLLYTQSEKRKLWIKPILLVLLCLIVIPLTVSILKANTGVFAPKELIPYGGENEHIGFLLQVWKYGHIAGGRCFPAGHSSGGFALMGLYLLPLSSKYKKGLLFLGLILGWFMGLYQMARGEHFITHTLFTQFFALFFISIVSQGCFRRQKITL